MDSAKEAMLVRRAYERAGRLKQRKTLRVIDEKEGDLSQERFGLHRIYQGVKLEDGRVANIALGQAKGEKLQLLSISRGDIALPLAEFNLSTGTVDLGVLEEGLSDEQRRGHSGNFASHCLC
ncbi:MAG: hypothetical protein WDN66_05395 [Candidatus Saccharibacteria bacterium]